MIPPISILRAALPALAALLVWSVASSAQAQTGGQSGGQTGAGTNQPAAEDERPRSRVFRCRAAISPRAMPASPAMPPPRRSTTARRCAATRAIRNCSAAPSWRCCQSGEIDEGGAARRAGAAGRQERPRRAPGARRAGDQAEAIRGGAPAARAVGARPDHRPGGGTALGLDLCRPDREQGGDRRHRQARRARNGTICQGPARRPDPRSVRPATRGAQAAGARLQARPDRAAGRAGLRQPAVARAATATRR